MLQYSVLCGKDIKIEQLSPSLGIRLLLKHAALPIANLDAISRQTIETLE